MERPTEPSLMGVVQPFGALAPLVDAAGHVLCKDVSLVDEVARELDLELGVLGYVNRVGPSGLPSPRPNHLGVWGRPARSDDRAGAGVDDLTGDLAAFIQAQEPDHPRDFLGACCSVGEVLQRPGGYQGVVVGVRESFANDRGAGDPWGDGVDVDPVRGEFSPRTPGSGR